MTAVDIILAATLATVERKPAEVEGRSTSAEHCYSSLLLNIVIHDCYDDFFIVMVIVIMKRFEAVTLDH